MATCGMESASMAADRPTRPITGKRAPRRSGSAASKPGTMPPPTSERRFVDIDPWAVLLEQLMEVPEESGATGEPEHGGTKDQPEPRRSTKKGRGRETSTSTSTKAMRLK